MEIPSPARVPIGQPWADRAEPSTILVVGSSYPGEGFIEACKEKGFRVLLLTQESAVAEPWPRHQLDGVFVLPSLSDRRSVTSSVSYLMRNHDLHRVAALSDSDIETAAYLREHLRLPGMGETTARYFRDQLAMRARAQDREIPVPSFVGILNHARITRFLRDVPPPWLLKPRFPAMGQRTGPYKLELEDEVWSTIESLGDAQSNYLLEQIIEGDVYHVDAIVENRTPLLAEVHRWRTPLLQVLHVQNGFLLSSATVERDSAVEQQVLELHQRLIEHLGLVRGVAHTEFIRSRSDQELYFLQTTASVPHPAIAHLVEASTGINLLAEAAKLELAQGEWPYQLPPHHQLHAGVILSSTVAERPDARNYNDPEIRFRLDQMPHEVGFVVSSDTHARVSDLLAQYQTRFARDFTPRTPSTLPPPPPNR